MEKFFAIVGKIVLVLLVVGGVAYSAFYIGKIGIGTSTARNESPQDSVTTQETGVPTPTPKQTRSITGGVSKEEGLAFDKYALEVPVDWSIERTTPAPASEQLIIVKGDYELKIFQAATGGALCLYPGDPDFEGPSSRFTKFVDLTTQDGRVLRRSGSDIPSKTGEVGFTICQRNTEGDFNQPTSYGHVSFSLPQNYGAEILTEMDAMITSLQKK